MITFKKRETTEGVRLAFHTDIDNMSLAEIEKKFKRNGKLHLGYHYVLHKNGAIDKGIEHELYADYELPHSETAVYVMVSGADLNDAQKHALRGLLDSLQLKLKED